MTPMHLLHVIESLQRGGAERLLVTTLRHLPRDRYRSTVACLFGRGGLADELRAIDVPVVELEVGRGFPGIVRAAGRLRRIVRAEEIDVVHTHLYHANIAGRLACRRRVPVVTSLHNPDYGFEDDGSLRFRARKWLDAWTGRRYTDRFLAVSEAVRDDYRRRMPFEGIEVVHNYREVEELRARIEGVDREKVRVLHGLGPTDFVVLHVGRFHRQKAHDVLLRAFRIARTEEPRLRLLLAGDGPTLGESRVLAEELHLQDAVVFLGAVDDVVPTLAAADAFAFPSRWEAFGIALLEAMTAGLPAVVTETGGIPEVATTETAIFVPPEREEPLAQGMLELARDRERRTRMGKAALERARDFDVARVLPRLEEVYRSL